MNMFDTFPSHARVWIYQANKPFPAERMPEIREQVAMFASQWVSHNRQLRAHGDVLHGRFVVLMVDESQADASGCSIDKSVHFLKQLEAAYGVDLFDRMTFSWKEGNEVRTAGHAEFAKLFAEGQITSDTLVFDNLVKTKGELDEKWLKPLNQSWHMRFV